VLFFSDSESDSDSDDSSSTDSSDASYGSSFDSMSFGSSSLSSSEEYDDSDSFVNTEMEEVIESEDPCFYGNQTTNYFAAELLTLDEYLRLIDSEDQ
jgi:hypothetical protein